MPIGQYKDFAACVAAQKRNGYSDESAHKICGKIEHLVKGSREDITEEEIDTILKTGEFFNDTISI